MSETIRICIAQLAPKMGDVAHNLARLIATLKDKVSEANRNLNSPEP